MAKNPLRINMKGDPMTLLFREFDCHRYDQTIPICRFGNIEGRPDIMTDHDRWKYSFLEKARVVMGGGEMGWQYNVLPQKLEDLGYMFTDTKQVVGVEMIGFTNVSNGYPVWHFNVYFAK